MTSGNSHQNITFQREIEESQGNNGLNVVKLN